MTIILGIDAAWTRHGSSGVALVRAHAGRCRVIAASPSYEEFVTKAGLAVHGLAMPDAALLLRACEALCDTGVDVVAVDMPLSRKDIVGRRHADNEISRKFARAWAGTHSPTPLRPGIFGRQLREQFENAGYPLTTCNDASNMRALIEVYPLAALVSFLQCDRRPEYKIGRIRRYWPTHSPAERIQLLINSWHKLREKMAAEIEGIPPVPVFEGKPRRDQLKQYEDQFDAILCAWIGACFIEGRARWFGDGDAGICVPLPR